MKLSENTLKCFQRVFSLSLSLSFSPRLIQTNRFSPSFHRYHNNHKTKPSISVYRNGCSICANAHSLIYIEKRAIHQLMDQPNIHTYVEAGFSSAKAHKHMLFISSLHLIYIYIFRIVYYFYSFMYVYSVIRIVHSRFQSNRFGFMIFT